MKWNKQNKKIIETCGFCIPFLLLPYRQINRNEGGKKQSHLMKFGWIGI